MQRAAHADGGRDVEDAGAWARTAVARCEQVWGRMCARYARRLAAQDRVRDARADVMTLAARRLLPLARRVLRSLPDDALVPAARAFNRLAPPDRYALSRLDLLGRLRGARAEHLASAFERLVHACRSVRASSGSLPSRGAPHAGEEGRSPCPGASRGLQM
jgi:hypothetical protein